jgi:hypothetical protein
VIIFGWGRRTFHHAGPVLYQRCPHCSNSGWFHLVVVRRWLTLFFMPVIPYERQHMLICPVCNRGVHLAGAELQRARSLNQLAVQYTSQAISGDEYMRRLRESGAPLTAAPPAPPALTSAAGPPAGFGTPSVTQPSIGPPMPSAAPAFRGTRMSRRAQVVRVAVPVLAIAVAATAWVLSSHTTNTNRTTSSFQAGDCINGSLSGTVITTADCSGTHDARIVHVLTGSVTFCPPTDNVLIVDPPNPNLCVNFNDHNP